MKRVIYQTYKHWYDRMQEFINANEQIKECDVCLLGDSIVEMIPEIKLNNLVFVNRGIVSDKSHGLLISLDDRVKAINPKTVLISIGSNDICDGYLLSEIQDNYEKIIEELKEFNPNLKIIVCTVTPPCYHHAEHVDRAYPDCRDILRLQKLNEVIKSFKDKYGVKVLDAYSILDDGTGSLALDDTLDGVHLTTKAYLKIKPEFIKLLEE